MSNTLDWGGVRTLGIPGTGGLVKTSEVIVCVELITLRTRTNKCEAILCVELNTLRTSVHAGAPVSASAHNGSESLT
eukprot:8553283-Pyramimonas_sp.AAC.1